MDLHSRYPALSDLSARAKRRIPHFVWEYLDSATGTETVKARNRAALDAVQLMPSILHGEFDPDLSVNMLGENYPLPFGIAPVGMSGLMWPDAERLLAQAATKAGIPYCLSNVATQTPEQVGPHVNGRGWFQLYPPRDETIRKDILARAKDNGFSKLVLTVDVPVASRRERQVRSGLTIPPRLTPRLLAQIAMRPAWAMGTLHKGQPTLATINSYATDTKSRDSTAHIGYLLRTSPDWGYLNWLRDHWDGDLIVKGVMRVADVPRLEAAGVNAIWVSNHAGRQFDGCPAAIEVLPEIRAATDLPIIFDSGLEGGLDICRALALGADFVMFGRAWHYALAALGTSGPAHFVDMLSKDLKANMGQMGAPELKFLKTCLR